MNDKISVIVPVYKVEDYLDRCVESIVRQTYSNLEIILVDDGSPDSCPLKCDEWAKRDTRIKVIHKENGGLSSARNSALDIITGNYIMFVDSDDTIHPLIIETLYKVLYETKSDISMCSWHKVYNISRPNNKAYCLDNTKIQIFEGDEVFALLFNKKLPLVMAAWAKLYKREIFDSIRYPVGLIHEDEKVIPEILDKCQKLSFVPFKMYNNTQRNDSITGNFFSPKRLIALDILRERIDFVRASRPKFLDDAIYYFMKISILYYYLVKWAKMDTDTLAKIKEPVMSYYKLGYSNRLIKMFLFHPRLLEFVIKIKIKFSK